MGSVSSRGMKKKKRNSEGPEHLSWFSLGIEALENHKHKEAIDWFTKVASFLEASRCTEYSEYTDSLLNSANCYRDGLGDIENAILAYEKVANHYSDVVPQCDEVSAAAMSKFEVALQSCVSLQLDAKVDPEQLLATVDRWHIFTLRQASRSLAGALFPPRGIVLISRSKILELLNRFDEAISDLETAILIFRAESDEDTVGYLEKRLAAAVERR